MNKQRSQLEDYILGTVDKCIFSVCYKAGVNDDLNTPLS